jgi:hypothetical protein
LRDPANLSKTCKGRNSLMKLKLLSTAALVLSLAAAPAAFTQETGGGTSPGTGSGASDPGSSATGDASGETNAPTIQTDQGKTSSTGGMNEGWTAADRSFFEEHNNLFIGFFTDTTMTTVRPQAEIVTSFQAMSAADQASVRAACVRVGEDRDSYSAVTTDLCAQIGQI